MKQKKAQAWGLDLTVASIIFIGGVIVFFIYSLNTPTQSGETILILQNQGDLVAKTLLSEGYPPSWQPSTVVTPGILTNEKIDQAKLESLYNLSLSNYEKMQSLLGTTADFYITLSQTITINNSTVLGIGKAPTNPKNLIKISRLTIYKEKPATLDIEVWE